MNANKWMTWIACISLLVDVARAGVLVQAPETSGANYSAWLKLRRDQSFVDYYIERHPSDSDRHLLAERFERAEQTLRNMAPNLALEQFNEVIDLRRMADWSNEDLQIIEMSFNRILEIKKQDRIKVLWEALSFSPSYKPTKGLIGDEELQAVLKEMREKAVLWKPLFQPEELITVILDGRVYRDPAAGIEVFPGLHRITVLSNRTVPDFYTVSETQLERIQSPSVFLWTETQGRERLWSGLENAAAVTVLQNNDHLKELSRPESVRAETPVETDALPLHLPEPIEKEQPFYAKKEFWLLTAGVLGALLVVHQSQKSEPTEVVPTHTTTAVRDGK